MKLYHGTSSKYLDSILQKGLVPRGKTSGNWKQAKSCATAVYLTDAYPLYFGVSATDLPEKPIIIEVDTDRLEKMLFAPDEDALEQGTRKMPGHAPLDKTMLQRTAWYRKRLLSHYASFDNTLASLKALGTCSYHDTIPPNAITKIVQVDAKDAPVTCMMGIDPIISILNYQIMGSKYRALTKWIFDLDLGEDSPPEPVTFENMVYQAWSLPPEDEKAGINVVYQN